MAIDTPGKSICYLGKWVVCKSVYCAGLQAGQGMLRSLMSQPIPAALAPGKARWSRPSTATLVVLGYVPSVGRWEPSSSQQLATLVHHMLGLV